MAATPCQRETLSVVTTTGPCTGSCDSKDKSLGLPSGDLAFFQVMQTKVCFTFSGKDTQVHYCRSRPGTSKACCNMRK